MAPEISSVGAPVAVPVPFKSELPFTYKPSSIVPKILSRPSASLISTNGSAVSITKPTPPSIPAPILSEALLVEAPEIVPKIAEALAPAVLP